MSLSVRPTRRVLARSITRSQSFAGVNDKSYRNLSVFSTPACVRKTPSRASRMFTLSTKSPPPKVPQPERLDEVYEALKRGLQSYLQVHQMELDSLNRQMKESKRNSRLQVKVIERFMRRLEFHLSKIDELYEAYCMQRRLRDGADKMVKAYTASPGSREARESLSEANKSFKEYTENMCMLESELENQLGEFHVKMKGLAGFARLCAGDQYEIFMKYGRQRWKLRGRIEINGKQVWDSEEMVFLPLITEFLSIKVLTELKSLANHVVVGSVSCETKDLFAALPQTVAVDINDLGTIKLSLEVTWNPFDKDDQSSSASTVNKAPTVNKRFSTYNQSPPDTPSLREQAFYNMLRRQEEMENGTAWSNSSESSDDSSSPQLSLGMRHAHKNLVQPEVQTAPPAIEISFAPRESATSTPTPTITVTTEAPVKQEVPNGHPRYSRSLSHISENSADGVLTDRLPGESLEAHEVTSVVSSLFVSDIAMDMPLRAEPCFVVRSRSRSSSVSLTVETALGSFDFLNTSDLEEEEEEDGERQSVTDRRKYISTNRSLSICIVFCFCEQRLGTFGPLRCGEMYALDRLLREARVLELIRWVVKDSRGEVIQPEEGDFSSQPSLFPTFSLQCTDGCSVYSTSTEAFLQALSATYASRLPERGAGFTDTVFLRLLERILERKLPRRAGGASKETLTLFQFWSYLEAEGVNDLDTHIPELAEEVWLVQCLHSGDQDVLVKSLKKPPECSLKREGLRAVSLLLRDPRGKVCSAASSLLRSLADQTRHRERALVSCLELLEDESVETRVCGCKALACLKAKESIEQLVYLCRTDKEDVRDAAKQALLVLGEEGKMAHRHLESSQDGMSRLFAPGSMASTAF
uniref:RHO family interacting cell polarization regulator 1 n=2 Tax=Cyprinus carpio TaxID=7962 RepID=A0A9J8D5P8_CYPCA